MNKTQRGRSLASTHRTLARQWHPERNGELRPIDVTWGSGKEIWWQCPAREDHVWRAAVQRRTGGSGCPFCSGRYATPDRSLAAIRPDLAAEWHPTRNGTLAARDVTTRTIRKVWWRCRFNPHHEWPARVGKRHSGNGCPFCAGHYARRKKRKRPKAKVPILV